MLTELLCMNLLFKILNDDVAFNFELVHTLWVIISFVLSFSFHKVNYTVSLSGEL